MKSSWMNEQNRAHLPFLVVPEILSPEQCFSVLEMANYADYSTCKTGDGEQFEVNLQDRKSNQFNISRNKDNEWLYVIVESLLLSGGQYWGFDVRALIDDIKLLRYEVGDHFQQWHSDSGEGLSNFRKLAVSIQLNPSTEFDGGQLEIFPEPRITLPQNAHGTAVLFPAHRMHRVTPVTRGIRHTLVCWISGPPLR